MDTQQKYKLIEKLVLSEDENLLSQIQQLIEGNELQFWDEMNPKLKASIKGGLEQSKAGIGVTHEDAMKVFRAKLGK